MLFGKEMDFIIFALIQLIKEMEAIGLSAKILIIHTHYIEIGHFSILDIQDNCKKHLHS